MENMKKMLGVLIIVSSIIIAGCIGATKPPHSVQKCQSLSDYLVSGETKLQEIDGQFVDANMMEKARELDEADLIYYERECGGSPETLLVCQEKNLEC